MTKIGKLTIVRAHHRKAHWRRLGKSSMKKAQTKMKKKIVMQEQQGKW